MIAVLTNEIITNFSRFCINTKQLCIQAERFIDYLQKQY